MRRHAGLFAFASAIFVVAFGAFLRLQPASDLTMHLAVARSLESISDITYPHFLLQLLIKAWVAVGVPPAAGLALLLGACYGGMAVLFALEAERRGVRLTRGKLWAVTADPGMLMRWRLVKPTKRGPKSLPMLHRAG